MCHAYIVMRNDFSMRALCYKIHFYINVASISSETISTWNCTPNVKYMCLQDSCVDITQLFDCVNLFSL